MSSARWFNPLRRSLQGRVVAGFLAIVAVMVGLGLFNAYQQRQLQQRANAMAVRDLRPLAHLRAAQEAHLEIVIYTLVLENVKAPEVRTPLTAQVNKYKDQATQAQRELRATAPGEMVPDVDRLTADRAAFLAAHEGRIAATAAGDHAKEATLDGQARDLSDKVGKDFTALAGTLTADAGKQRQSIAATAGTSLKLIVAVLLAGVVLAMLLAMWIARSIRRPVDVLMRSIERIAAGDLTQEIEVVSQDELGRTTQALHRAMGAIRGILSGVADSAAALAVSSDGLTATSQRLANAARSASGRAEEVSTVTHQMSMNVDTVSSGAQEMGASIREIAQNAMGAATVGEEAVVAARATTEIVGKLGVSSTEIGNVLKVITSIAAQTNLLALNATIEAARAGDAGKGFAVVAGEVKDLAQETAKATGDIGRRIEAIQTDTGNAVDAIATIGEIIDRINNYQTMVASAVEEQSATSSEMSRSATEAAMGTNAIASAIAEVAASTTETTTGITETEHAATELSQLSGQLQDLVGKFRY